MNDLSDDDEKTLDKVWDDFHKSKGGKSTSVSTSAQLKSFDDKLAQKVADTWYRKDGSPKTRAMMEHQIQDTMERYNLDLNEAASLMDRSHELNNVYDEHYTPESFNRVIEKMRSPDYPYVLPEKREESKSSHEYSEQPIEDRKVKSLLGTRNLDDPFRDDIKDTQHSMDHPDKLLRKNLKIREPKNKTRNNFGKIPSGLTTDKPEKDLDDENPNSDIDTDHEEVINKKGLIIGREIESNDKFTTDDGEEYVSPKLIRHIHLEEIPNEEREVKAGDGEDNRLIGWHGSKNGDFDTFHESYIGQTDPGYYGRGFYFSPNKEDAESYGPARKFHLKTSNPFIVHSNGELYHDSLYDLRDKLADLTNQPHLKTNRKIPEGYELKEGEIDHPYASGKKLKVYSVEPKEHLYGTEHEIYGKEVHSPLKAIIDFNDKKSGIDAPINPIASGLIREMTHGKHFHDILKDHGYDSVHVVNPDTKKVKEMVVFDPKKISLIKNKDNEEVINKKSLQHDHEDPVKLFLVGSIQTDPDRLQYKDYNDKDGLNDERRGDKNTLNDGKPKEIFDPLKCPPIALWKDEDGQITVVDGHKRLGAAKRDGSSIIRGYFVHADDADEAKDIGERINTNMGTKSIQTPGKEEG